MDGSGGGMGIRSKRYSMLVEDGVVKKLNIEEKPGTVEVSGGDALTWPSSKRFAVTCAS